MDAFHVGKAVDCCPQVQERMVAFSEIAQRRPYMKILGRRKIAPVQVQPRKELHNKRERDAETDLIVKRSRQQEPVDYPTYAALSQTLDLPPAGMEQGPDFEIAQITSTRPCGVCSGAFDIVSSPMREILQHESHSRGCLFTSSIALQVARRPKIRVPQLEEEEVSGYTPLVERYVQDLAPDVDAERIRDRSGDVSDE